MSNPSSASESMLLISVMCHQGEDLNEIIGSLEEYFGPIIEKSDEYDFSYTKFYEKEFGQNLKKIFFVFEKRFVIEDLPNAKLMCFGLENKYMNGKNRMFNIDAGYITKNSIVLATFKHRSHRIYLSQGVYADLELLFENGSWKELQWTFMDMKEEILKKFFEKIRKAYL